ncbi:MAG TPA: hypothetical protein VEH27_09365 [Methylomirabilota bacterium]|nr:hypothetical protein [Methylomirabilota bacterium]
MKPQRSAFWQLAVLVGVVALLLFLFPGAVAFAERAARNVRYLWWIVLLLALAIWLISGATRRPK